MTEEDNKFVDFLVNEVGDELDDGLDDLDEDIDNDSILSDEDEEDI